MKVALVFRSKERNEFSIEALFESLKKYIGEKLDTEDFFLPSGRYNRLPFLIRNYRFAKTINADIYHITGEVNFIAPAFPKSKTIITVHDYVDLETIKGLKGFIRWLFWCYIPFKRCKYIACISNKTLNETVERFPFTKDKVVYIPNPIDDSYIKVPKVFNTAKPRILVIGTRINKNVERIIEAVKDISCELYIIGILTEEQRTLLGKYSIEYKNVFHITDEEVHQAYCDCDMLCFPSTYEGFGRPIIEANAIGRPVVTSNLEPMVEVANGTAALVDPFDADSIKTGIQKVINVKSLREKLISLGYDNAKKYSADKVAGMYTDLYMTMGK